MHLQTLGILEATVVFTLQERERKKMAKGTQCMNAIKKDVPIEETMACIMSKKVCHHNKEEKRDK